MGPANNTCPHCGTILDADIRFCKECGKPIPVAGGEKSEPISRTKSIPKGTIIAFQLPKEKESADSEKEPGSAYPTQPGVGQSSSPPAAMDSDLRQTHPGLGQSSSPPPQGPATASQPSMKGRTMIGMPAQFEAMVGKIRAGEPAPSPEVERSRQMNAQDPLEPAATTNGVTSSGNHPEYAKTMLGFVPAEPSAASPTPPNQPRPISPKGTMLGYPSAEEIDSLRPAPGEPAEGEEEHSMDEEATPSDKVPSIRPDSGRTMLGVAQATTSESETERLDESLYEPVKKISRKPQKKGGRSASTFLVLGLVVAVVGAASYFFVLEKKSKVQASVVTLDDGEAMQFDVPGAPTGSKIRFGGQEKNLVAGRTTFRLAPDSLQVGNNVVPVDYIDPNGKAESSKLSLNVDFRIRVDTSALQTDKPGIDVIVNTHPGTRVSLDGVALPLDASGSAVRRFPIDSSNASTSGTIDKVIHYRLEPPNAEAIVNEIHTKVPVATMQIDRPGSESVTDRASVEIAGAVSPNSRVTIDGQDILVKAGRFLHELSLPKPGTYKPSIVAGEPGKASQSRTLIIKRVTDLKKEAENFKADPTLTFARISQNPSIYTGQKVDMVGRVYNVNVQEGQSTIQVLVRECPAGRRCSLWVAYPAATDVVINSWIRVLGVIAGEQQFRSENNQVVTVPKVTATFILPVDR
jgi:hypothetical protein